MTLNKIHIYNMFMFMYIHKDEERKFLFTFMFSFFYIHHAPSHVVEIKRKTIKKRILWIFTVKGNEMKMHCTQYITSVNYVMLHYIEDGKGGKKGIKISY